MKALTTLSLLIFFTAGREAKIFARCHLASFLKLNGLDGYRGIRLNDCDKSVTSRKNRLIQFFGIFQINNHWWCDNNHGYSSQLISWVFFCCPAQENGAGKRVSGMGREWGFCSNLLSGVGREWRFDSILHLPHPPSHAHRTSSKIF
uniref:Lysozyme n=1 Tax=Laticauda laticaudata TaxID=8630 RepID=A0A8C5WY92_LATLA